MASYILLLRVLHYEDIGVHINCEIQTNDIEQIRLKVTLYAHMSNWEVFGSSHAYERSSV
jgi:hypothetical protein